MNPNFFILGAPKCGTTSLAAWLEAHPHVFFSPLKEPSFFNTDHKLPRVVNGTASYERLFERAEPEKHRAVGEGSTWYLYSLSAVSNILDRYGDGVRFMVMVRDPIEMAVSLHMQLLRNGYEHIRDFERAWRAQNERRLGQNIAGRHVDKSLLLYGDICSVGGQLKRLFTHLHRENVLVMTLDDLAQDPRGVYCRALEFLDVEDDGRVVFEGRNTARVARSVLLDQAVERLTLLKNRLGIYRSFGVRQMVTQPAAKPHLSEKFYAELAEFFVKDVRLLQQLMERDLSHYLSGNS